MNPRPQPNRRRATVRLATVAVLAVLAAAGATALGGSQEPAPAPPPVGPPIAPPLGAGPSPAEQRLRELFVEVELALREIDDLLFDAAAGEAELDPRDAGIGRLLEQTEAKSREAVAGIDEILRVAREMEQQQQQQQSQQQQQGGQGQGSGQNSGGPSPLDGRSPGPRQQDLPGQGQQDPSTDQNQPQPRPDRSDGEPEDGPPTVIRAIPRGARLRIPPAPGVGAICRRGSNRCSTTRSATTSRSSTATGSIVTTGA
jgi:hypothetical protein